MIDIIITFMLGAWTGATIAIFTIALTRGNDNEEMFTE